MLRRSISVSFCTFSEFRLINSKDTLNVDFLLYFARLHDNIRTEAGNSLLGRIVLGKRDFPGGTRGEWTPLKRFSTHELRSSRVLEVAILVHEINNCLSNC